MVSYQGNTYEFESVIRHAYHIEQLYLKHYAILQYLPAYYEIIESALYHIYTENEIPDYHIPIDDIIRITRNIERYASTNPRQLTYRCLEYHNVMLLVSKKGHIIKLDDKGGRELRHLRKEEGIIVKLSNNNYVLVGELVGNAFMSNPDMKEVKFINGDRNNYSLDNLEF